MDYEVIAIWVWSILVVGFLLYKIRLLEDRLSEFENDTMDNVNDIFTILVEMDKKTKRGKNVKR